MSDLPNADDAGVPCCRILVVEDEYFLADDLRLALTAVGLTTVGPYDDPAEALEALRTDPGLHGAVLDINLHGTPVFPLAEALRARSIPFVFATGYDQAAIPPGFEDVPRWEKPFDPAALARALAPLAKGRS